MERSVKIKNPADGQMMDGVEVPVVESTERWTEVKLEDGSVIRVKPTVMSAIRIPGQFDQDGNPMYLLKTGNAMMIAEAQEHFKKPALEAAAARKAN